MKKNPEPLNDSCLPACKCGQPLKFREHEKDSGIMICLCRDCGKTFRVSERLGMEEITTPFITLKNYYDLKFPPTVYIAAMNQAREVTGVAPDMWVVTGKGLNQRSWCCHAGTPLFKSKSDCDLYIANLKKGN